MCKSKRFQLDCLSSVILLLFLGYSLYLLNLGISPNKIPRLRKNLQNWVNKGRFWIGKQPVFDCNIGKIKSLEQLSLTLFFSFFTWSPYDSVRIKGPTLFSFSYGFWVKFNVIISAYTLMYISSKQIY